MLNLTRHGRTRVTITGLISTVVFCAVILGCIVEIQRIKRAQAFFRQMSSIYAQRETLERSKISSFLDMAQFDNSMAESEKESIERLRSGGGRQFGEVDSHLRWRVRFYHEHVASERRCLSYASEARIKADRFAILKQTYATAANSLWLPFAPSPLAVRHPENGGRASLVKRRLPADEADEADEVPLERTDETEKSAKPKLRETPSTFSISGVRRRDGIGDGGLSPLVGGSRRLGWRFELLAQQDLS